MYKKYAMVVVYKQTNGENNMKHTILEPKAYQLLILKAGLKTYISGSKLRLTRSMTPKAILNQVGMLTGNDYKVSKSSATKALNDLQQLIELYKTPSYNA